MRTRLAPLLIAAVAALTGCSSTVITAHPSRSPALSATITTTSPATSSSPPTSTGPTPVTTPAIPPPVKRTLHRPPGARLMTLDTCIQPNEGVATFIEQFVFDRTSVADQLSGLKQVVDETQSALPEAQLKRQAWLAGGYPAAFPAVQDLTGIIDAEQKLIQAGDTQGLSVIPGLYRQFKIGFNQYNADLNNSPGLCQD